MNAWRQLIRGGHVSAQSVLGAMFEGLLDAGQQAAAEQWRVAALGGDDAAWRNLTKPGRNAAAAGDSARRGGSAAREQTAREEAASLPLPP